MSTQEDQLFDQNLHVAGARVPVPDGPSPDVVSRCANTLAGASTSTRRRPLGWFAPVALAASIALAFGLFGGPFETGPKVQAATILARFNEQIAAPKVIELTLDSIAVDNVEVDGYLQVSTAGVAGDLHVIVAKGDVPLEVDLSLGVSSNGGWILIRKIEIPDPKVQAMLSLFFPSGSETLLKFPADMVGSDFALNTGDFDEIMDVLSTKILLETFQVMIANQPDTAATIVERRDGMVVLTLPIADANALESLIRMAAKVIDGKDIPEGDIEIDTADGATLFGSTLEIEYDPTAELVRSFSIRDFGKKNGTLSVSVSGDSLDPALLDSSRVAGPDTRTVDIAALMSLLKQFDR